MQTITLIADNDEPFAFPFKQLRKKSRFIQRYLTACDNNPNIKKTDSFNVDYDQAIVRIYHKYITQKKLPKKLSFGYDNYDVIDELIAFANYIGDDNFKNTINFEREFRPLLHGIHFMSNWIDNLSEYGRKHTYNDIKSIDAKKWLTDINIEYQLGKNIDNTKKTLASQVPYITEALGKYHDDYLFNKRISTELDNCMCELSYLLEKIYYDYIEYKHDIEYYEVFRTFCLFINMSKKQQQENLGIFMLHIYYKYCKKYEENEKFDECIEKYRKENTIDDLLEWGDNLIKYYNEKDLKITTISTCLYNI